jgi:hypothetical protein
MTRQGRHTSSTYLEGSQRASTAVTEARQRPSFNDDGACDDEFCAPVNLVKVKPPEPTVTAQKKFAELLQLVALEMQSLGFKKSGGKFSAERDGFRSTFDLHRNRKGSSRFSVHLIDDLQLTHVPSERLQSGLSALLQESGAPYRSIQLGRWYINSLSHLLPNASSYPRDVEADKPVEDIAEIIIETFRERAIPALETRMADPAFVSGVLLMPAENTPKPFPADDLREAREMSQAGGLQGEEAFYEFAEHPNPAVRRMVFHSLRASLLGGGGFGVRMSHPGYEGLQAYRSALLGCYQDPDRMVRTLRRVALSDPLFYGEAESILENLGQEPDDADEPQLQIWQAFRPGLRRFDGTETDAWIFGHAASRAAAATRLGVDPALVEPAAPVNRLLFLRLGQWPHVVWCDTGSEAPIWYELPTGFG